MTAPAPRPARESRTVMSELMMPHMANNIGSVFGGVIMSLMDRVAAVAAMRHAGCPVVTVAVDQIDFHEPIRLGEVVTAYAAVNFVGRTSMEVGVRFEAENPLTRERRHTNSSYLTFVGIDADRRPVPVPQVVPETEQEKRWYGAAKERRAARLTGKHG